MSESKVTSGQYNLGSAVDLQVKVGGALASTSSVDLRVKVFIPLGGHKQGDTGTASTSGRTCRSSRGRGGVEEAAETRLNNLAEFRVFIYFMGLEV